MFKKFLSVFLVLIFILMLTNSQMVFEGAQNGLILWAQTVVPALLPYMICSGIMIKYDLCNMFSLLFRPFTLLLRIRKECAFCIFSGLFFGYPMCAVNASSMYQKGIISKDEMELLCCSFNNLSPAFVATYVYFVILNKTVKLWKIMPIYYIIILLSTFAIRVVFFRNLKNVNILESSEKSADVKNSDVLVQSIINICKIGCYIIIFCIITKCLTYFDIYWVRIFCSYLEITTGLLELSANVTGSSLFVIAMTAICFGGISGIFQTFSSVSGRKLSIKKYIYSKLITAALGGLISYLAVYVFKLI